MSSEATVKKNIQKLQRAIVDGLEDVKAQDIQVYNTEGLSPLFERVVIATGSSNRQTKALAASVRDSVREAGFDKPRTEGEENGEWIIVDCGPAVVHVMQPGIRQYYRLEEIWGETPVRLKSAAARHKAALEAAAGQAAAAPKRRASAKSVAATPELAPAQAAPAKRRTRAAAEPEAKPKAARPSVSKASGKTAAKTAPAKTSTRAGAKPAAKSTRSTASKGGARPAATKVAVVKVGAPVKKAASKTAAKPAARKTAPKTAPKKKA
jgi:ribosome-associated protein